MNIFDTYNMIIENAMIAHAMNAGIEIDDPRTWDNATMMLNTIGMNICDARETNDIDYARGLITRAGIQFPIVRTTFRRMIGMNELSRALRGIEFVMQSHDSHGNIERFFTSPDHPDSYIVATYDDRDALIDARVCTRP